MKKEKAKLTDILAIVKTQLQARIEKGVSGVAYMYIVDNKILSVSIEDIVDDTGKVEATEELKEEVVEEETKKGE